MFPNSSLVSISLLNNSLSPPVVNASYGSSSGLFNHHPYTLTFLSMARVDAAIRDGQTTNALASVFLESSYAAGQTHSKVVDIKNISHQNHHHRPERSPVIEYDDIGQFQSPPQTPSLHPVASNLRHSLPFTIVLILAYLIVFFFGLFGNLSVLWIVYMLKRETKYRQSGVIITTGISLNNNNNLSGGNVGGAGVATGSIMHTTPIMNIGNNYNNGNSNSNLHLNGSSSNNSSNKAKCSHTQNCSQWATTMADGSTNQTSSTVITNTATTTTRALATTSLTVPANSGTCTPMHQTAYYTTSAQPVITINRSNQVFYRFVCNLALADLLVVIFCLIPTLLGNIYLPWVLGRSVCKAVPYLQGVSVNASVYTLVAISIDRFYAIYYPLNKKCSTVMCWTTIISIWLFSMVISFPWLVYFDVITINIGDFGPSYASTTAAAAAVAAAAATSTVATTAATATTTATAATTISTLPKSMIDEEIMSGSVVSMRPTNSMTPSAPFESATESIQICGDTWPSAEMANAHFLVVNLGLQYLIPLSIIALFYILILKKIAERKLPKLARHLPANVKDGNRQSSLVIERSKVKVFKMLIVIVLLFALSWLPLYLIFFILKIGPKIDEQSWTMQLLQDSVPIAQWLGASNSCVNPILYFFFNAKFRSYYRSTWLKTFGCLSAIRHRHHHGGLGSGSVASSTTSRQSQQSARIKHLANKNKNDGKTTTTTTTIYQNNVHYLQPPPPPAASNSNVMIQCHDDDDDDDGSYEIKESASV